MPDARSLIVVAFRDSLVRFSFAGQGEVTKLAVPPTYLHWQEKDKKVEDVLNGILGLEGYRATPAAVPKKLLAVRGGLAVYRKNNITYIDGMGSFHRLTAFYSDLPCKKDGWREPVMMALCERCLSCVRHSPTGAIDPDRFLLRAEKCLVFLNEKPGRVAFPDWVEGSWHNCLVG
jgi:epoxyqueuosine reductase